MSTDPSAIRSLAVSAEDLLAAAEASARDGPNAVLRVTPPYSGRMRARLHVVQGDADDETLHVPPASFLREDAPPYPTPDQTADELRDRDDETYGVARHREYHERRVAEWRETLPDYVVETVTIPADGHEVRISLLGP
ncbi:hypothetical protein [Haloarcula nitratireducens]|uniref:DUF8009 domain-containing protein n=1 Tax=Haloarcula nitratireducens TaxID=2487749 RepID=A0AAW4PB59_9EURY|nr:hypothetical protein [Halomicroarcula nitratireducens]MBX0294823.1 hypothetical protein [Halomicroarcula nitratireducens]